MAIAAVTASMAPVWTHTAASVTPSDPLAVIS